MRYISFLLLILSASSYAQTWDLTVSSSAGNQYYLDRSSVKSSDGFIAYTQLTNYPSGYQINELKALSIVQKRLTDCKRNQFKTIETIAYSKVNATGDVIFTHKNTQSDWISINLDKITGDIQRKVCSSFRE